MLADTGWLLDRHLGSLAEGALYRSVAACELVGNAFSPVDWTRIAGLTERYSHQHLGARDGAHEGSSTGTAPTAMCFRMDYIRTDGRLDA